MNPPNGNVYIVQRNPRLNYVDAKRFGELRTLYERDAFPDNASDRTEAMAVMARKLLTRFDPKKDYVLMSGDPIAISIVSMVLAESHPAFNVLKWDNEEHVYYPVLLDPTKSHVVPEEGGEPIGN